MQRDPDALEALLEQLRQRAVARIKGVRVDGAAAQRLEHGVAAEERDLALARVAAEEHRDAPEVGRLADAAQVVGS